MTKYSVVIEVSMDDDYKEMVGKWGVEPSDHVATILSETAREKGLVVKASVLETEHSLFDRQQNKNIFQSDSVIFYARFVLNQ